MKNHPDTDIQRIHVLNEQAGRWSVMNRARREGRPYLPLATATVHPHDTDADEEFDAFGERRFG